MPANISGFIVIILDILVQWAYFNLSSFVQIALASQIFHDNYLIHLLVLCRS